MFDSKIKKDYELRQKTLIDKKLDIYSNEMKLEIKKGMINATYEQKMHTANLKAQCASDSANCEHEYHYAKELKGIELAKLDAKIIERRNYSDEYDKYMMSKLANKDDIIRTKDAEITRLAKLLEVMVNALSNPTTCNIENNNQQ